MLTGLGDLSVLLFEMCGMLLWYGEQPSEGCRLLVTCGVPTARGVPPKTH